MKSHEKLLLAGVVGIIVLNAYLVQTQRETPRQAVHNGLVEAGWLSRLLG